MKIFRFFALLAIFATGFVVQSYNPVTSTCEIAGCPCKGKKKSSEKKNFLECRDCGYACGSCGCDDSEDDIADIDDTAQV